MNPVDRWTVALVHELGLESAVDVRGLLELSRTVAHAVERPAAPVTTYMLGLAVGRAGEGRSFAELVELIGTLAASWDAAAGSCAPGVDPGTDPVRGSSPSS